MNYYFVRADTSLLLDRVMTIKTLINEMVFDAKPSDATAKVIRVAMLLFTSLMTASKAVKMKKAQAIGIAYSKQTKTDAHKGWKPSVVLKQFNSIFQIFNGGTGINQIARDVKMGKCTVTRIARDSDKVGRTFAR